MLLIIYIKSAIILKLFKSLGGTLSFIKCYLSKILGERRISQSELARMSRLSTFTINKFYNERWKGVDQHTMVALCKALKVQVGDLFEYIETKDKRRKTKPRPMR